MTTPAPPPGPPGTRPPEPPSRAAGMGSAMMRAGGSTTEVRGRSRLPMRLIVGVLGALLLFGTATHIEPAIRAGMREGTAGTWIATSKECVRTACQWKGKFVTPGGHVLLTSAQYSGRLPADMHVGTSIAGLYPGGSGLIFPTSGSDLWISLLIAMLASLVGLYWACRPMISNYLRQRAEDNLIR